MNISLGAIAGCKAGTTTGFVAEGGTSKSSKSQATQTTY